MPNVITELQESFLTSEIQTMNSRVQTIAAQTTLNSTFTLKDRAKSLMMDIRERF